MLKIKSNLNTKNFDGKSILELFDYTQFKKPYHTMKISWYHRIRLAIDDFTDHKFSKMIKILFGLFLPTVILSNLFNMPLLGLSFIITIFSPLFISILPYNNSINNVCKTLTNYFNKNSSMETKFYLLKQKLLSPQGKATLAKDINNDDYGYIVKDIIQNLLCNDDMKLLDNVLQLGNVQTNLNIKTNEEKENNTQNENLLDALKYHSVS